MLDEQIELLQSGVKELTLSLKEEQIEKLLQFVLLIQKWNKIYNLTAIDRLEDMINKHVLDSLTAAKYLQGKKIVDVGSGAGLPGIPLAIVCKEKQFLLLDANAKKTRFIQQVIISLGLRNVKVLQQRVEQFKPHNSFDTVISRAFANQAKFLDVTQQLLNHGQIILMLGKQSSLKSLPKGYTVKSLSVAAVPNLKADRHIAVIEKAI